MWDLRGPGLEPLSPALAGGFLTTAPPGKSIRYLQKHLPEIFGKEVSLLFSRSFLKIYSFGGRREIEGGSLQRVLTALLLTMRVGSHSVKLVLQKADVTEQDPIGTSREGRTPPEYPLL